MALLHVSRYNAIRDRNFHSAPSRIRGREMVGWLSFRGVESLRSVDSARMGHTRFAQWHGDKPSDQRGLFTRAIAPRVNLFIRLIRDTMVICYLVAVYSVAGYIILLSNRNFHSRDTKFLHYEDDRR